MAPTFDSNAVWLVTGASSGFGKSLVQHIYNAGHNVVATARNVKSLEYLPEGPKVLKLALDVTSKEAITSVFDATLKRFGRLDVTINNAGYHVVGEFEGFPEEDSIKQIETLFWGPVRITRESLRIFREVNPAGQGGTIVQISSMGGFIAFPGGAFYHAGKSALEAFTKTVSQELDPKWNISMFCISPGGIKTNFLENLKPLNRHPAYADNPDAPLNKLLEYMSNPSISDSWADSAKCASAVFDAVTGQKERPLPIRLNLGVDTLPLIREEIDRHVKQMKDWEEVTASVL